MYVVEIEVMGLPVMANGSRKCWQQKSRETKDWKQRVGYALLGKAPRKPLKKSKAVFTRCSSINPDYDGLVHGFKSLCDALTQYGFIEDDGPTFLEREYKWEYAAPKKGKVRIRLEEV